MSLLWNIKAKNNSKSLKLLDCHCVNFKDYINYGDCRENKPQ